MTSHASKQQPNQSRIAQSSSETNILDLAHKYKFAPSALREARNACRPVTSASSSQESSSNDVTRSQSGSGTVRKKRKSVNNNNSSNSSSSGKSKSSDESSRAAAAQPHLMLVSQNASNALSPLRVHNLMTSPRGSDVTVNSSSKDSPRAGVVATRFSHRSPAATVATATTGSSQTAREAAE